MADEAAQISIDVNVNLALNRVIKLQENPHVR
jgi:hypothetical protein